MAASNLSTPTICFVAQTIPQQFKNGVLNPDVGGAAVAISNIVINLALRQSPFRLHITGNSLLLLAGAILLRWAENSDIQASIYMLLSQVLPVMLATATSINTQNLSLFDAHFAIAATASPVSIYLAYSSFRDLIGRPNALFKKITYGKITIRYLGLILPVLWCVISILISFSPRAFRNSPDNCTKMTFVDWIQFQTLSNFVGILDVMGQRDLWNDLEDRGGLGTLSLVVMWIWSIYIVRHRHDIYDEIQYRRRITNKLGDYSHGRIRSRATKIALSSPLAPIRFIWHLIAASWFVITRSHPWTILVIVMFLHWSWILGIEKSMTIYRFELSYGQVISIFSILPPIWSIKTLLTRRGGELLQYMQRLPSSFKKGCKYLALGLDNPWDQYLMEDEERKEHPRNTFRFFFERKRWLIYMAWAVAVTADVFWIIAYVKAGSRPNPRSPVNDPHSGWKPFSIMMYVYGYCACYVNILCWVTFYEPPEDSSSQRKYPSLWRAVLRVMRISLIPLAFITSAGPLFAPFAALPLAQQWQWSHFCDSSLGEVLLQGTANADGSQNATATFYYPNNSEFGRKETSLQYQYTLTHNSTNAGLVFNSSLVNSSALPNIMAVSYNLASQTFTVFCWHPSGSNQLCAIGNYTTKPDFSFAIHDMETGLETRLRAQNNEWEFSNDAPSFVLKNVESDGHLGTTVIQSAVTQRSHCELLKVCVSSSRPDLGNIVPLGIALMAQDEYAHYCLLPRLYLV